MSPRRPRCAPRRAAPRPARGGPDAAAAPAAPAALSRRQALRGAAALGAAGLAAGALGGAAPLWAEARRAYALEPRQVAAGIWMIEGRREYFSAENGGAIVNCALIETDEGVLAVDLGPSLRYGEELRAAALRATGRPVFAALVTHQHPDHFMGAQAFADLPVLALAETQRQIALHGDSYADNMYRLLGDWMRGSEATPPNAVVEPGEVALGGRPFLALALSGHTPADLALLDRRTGTLIAGDLAFLDRAPTTPDADLDAWRRSIEQLAALDAAATLPGHGPIDPEGRALRQTRAYLDWLDGALRDGAERGLSMPELMAAPLPPEFAAMGVQPDEFARSVVHLYPAYERAAMPRADHG
ncbi:quinoprotein relay system zinc metallohydrolase 1 [Oceanicella actignis]|uniref:Quinoprotein relay system zinc metallohydrolase 1 n=1 Tax=Oceanicella actignis TaxID=1189325 RepID=A0A1M7RRG0_9RHOB|nr:quinoprotein relay system zinc metallohydrolase 1 [Oceanicella actignis]SET08115.1 quinoprotein relay system zinc metallohydrolase 1 [Oceanicella actignis]SHN48686.1 quinoprotein relay system zinc metallohydrolase 1 [Oceanicella actignis]